MTRVVTANSTYRTTGSDYHTLSVQLCQEVLSIYLFNDKGPWNH